MGRGQRRHLIAGIAISSVMFAACAASGDEGAIDEARTALDETVAFATKDWDTDWANATIDLDELLLGIGATEPRDAIAPIDEPHLRIWSR